MIQLFTFCAFPYGTFSCKNFTDNCVITSKMNLVDFGRLLQRYAVLAPIMLDFQKWSPFGQNTFITTFIKTVFITTLEGIYLSGTFIHSSLSVH